MPRENDLEGQQDQGGKHGGQAGMPRTSPAPDQGIVRDDRGQEQPRDKDRAQRVSRQDKGNDPPGDKSNQRWFGRSRSSVQAALYPSFAEQAL